MEIHCLAPTFFFHNDMVATVRDSANSSKFLSTYVFVQITGDKFQFFKFHHFPVFNSNYITGNIDTISYFSYPTTIK